MNESDELKYLNKYCYYEGCRGLIKYVGKVEKMQSKKRNKKIRIKRHLFWSRMVKSGTWKAWWKL